MRKTFHEFRQLFKTHRSGCFDYINLIPLHVAFVNRWIPSNLMTTSDFSTFFLFVTQFRSVPCSARFLSAVQKLAKLVRLRDHTFYAKQQRWHIGFLQHAKNVFAVPDLLKSPAAKVKSAETPEGKEQQTFWWIPLLSVLCFRLPSVDWGILTSLVGIVHWTEREWPHCFLLSCCFLSSWYLWSTVCRPWQ